jgi:hypothetical protein
MAVKTIKVLGAAGAEQQTHLKRLQAEIDLMKDLRSPYIVGKYSFMHCVLNRRILGAIRSSLA